MSRTRRSRRFNKYKPLKEYPDVQAPNPNSAQTYAEGPAEPQKVLQFDPHAFLADDPTSLPASPPLPADTKRAVIGDLFRSFLPVEGKGVWRYVFGSSDKVVADANGIAVDQVAQVRMELFGPIAPTEDYAALRLEIANTIAEVREQADTLLSGANDLLDAVANFSGFFLPRLAQLECRVIEALGEEPPPPALEPAATNSRLSPEGRILAMLAGGKQMTNLEMTEKSGMPSGTVSGRVAKMRDKGLVVICGQRRDGQSSRHVPLWKLTDQAGGAA
jgi:DNA-binding transcriptional ArsR family regulator